MAEQRRRERMLKRLLTSSVDAICFRGRQRPGRALMQA